MGVTHHCIANSSPDAEVVTIADPSQLVTRVLAKYAHVSAHKDYRSMLDKEKLDAVLVCTPPTANADILRAVADSNLHAFVEKPFTLDPVVGRDLAQLFESKGLVGQVGYVSRFTDTFVRTRALLDQGVIGKVVRYRTEMYSPTILRDPGEGSWRASHANGGGVTYEFGSHVIDLINYVVGRPIGVSGSALTHVFSKSVEDIVSTVLRHESGLVGSLYVTWSEASFRKPTLKFELFGDRGKIQADQHGLKVFCADVLPEHGLGKGWNQFYVTDLYTPVPFYLRGFDFSAQIYHFLDHVRRGDPATRCTLSDGADVLELIQDIFRDSQAGGSQH